MRRLGFAIVLAGLLATAAAPAALGCTTKIPVSDKETTVTQVSPGVITTNGSVVSLRGMVVLETDESTSAFVAGKSKGVVNYDIGPTGIGKIWGTDTKRPTAYPHGHWDCSFSGKMANGTWTAKGTCVGRGTLKGWKYTADLAQMPTFVAATGYVFRVGHR
jgi:hypothetical protein